MVDKAPCSHEGCDRIQKAKGYCPTHYEQLRRGEPLKTFAPRKYLVQRENCITPGCQKLQRSSDGFCGSCWATNKRNENRRKAILLSGDSCLDCGRSYPDAVYDFHHLDEKKKSFNLAAGWHKNWDEIAAELEKVVLLCPTCHRIRHL